MRTIIITWMDDRQETYPADDYRVIDGVLYIKEEYGVSAMTKNQWWIPTKNIRVWKVEK